MYGAKELKNNIIVTGEKVSCPVKGCTKLVKRQRNIFKTEDAFFCKAHKLYISPSTFEYLNERDNLLWHSPEDAELLSKIKKVKRESRMVRDNSEDAVTWNVFRYLENTKLLAGFVNGISNQNDKTADIIYWSYSQQDNRSWTELNKARLEFGEKISAGSEPDIIVKTDKAIFFIECKINAGNDTVPGNTEETKKYITGGDGWYYKVLRSKYKNVAIVDKKYELMRFWLLGSWLAKQLQLDFHLVNLVPERKEQDIEEKFKKHICADESRKFARISWENIYQYIKNTAQTGNEKDFIMNYFENKTIGYNSRGELQKGFSIEE